MRRAAAQIGRAAGVAAPGLLVLGVILFMGAISGAHLNPAVTLSFAPRGDFPWRRVPGYIVVQLVAASAAVLVLRGLFGNIGNLGATLPGHGFSDVQATAVELPLTFGLVSTIPGRRRRRRMSVRCWPSPWRLHRAGRSAGRAR